MALKAVYLPDLTLLENNGLIRITGDEHRHLMVGRAAPGELVEAFDGRGEVWTVRMKTISKRESEVEVVEKRRVLPEASELVLGMALVRPAAFELALEKAVEIGVSRVAPFLAARSNVSAPRRPERWMKIVIEAAKQSKRYCLPVVEDPVEFGRLVAFPAATRVVLTERGGGRLPELKGGSVLYVVGPEGGWTDAELEQLRASGFVAVSLGDGILKAETAAIVGGGLIRYAMGER